MSTQLNMVIGYPLEHSQSPLLHDFMYRKLNIDATLVAHSHIELENLIQSIKSLSVKLIAVTLPFKEKILRYLDDSSPEVKALQAANTLIQCEGKLVGYNTDIDGIAYALRDISVAGKQVLVIGAGGAARAIGYYMQKNTGKLLWMNRTQLHAVTLAKEFGGKVVIQDDLNTFEIDIIINTTPQGMYPNIDISPLPDYKFHAQQIVFDMVYHPIQTKLLKQAAAQQAQVISGLDMFIGQGVRQIELFTGKNIILNPMLDSLRKVLIEDQQKIIVKIPDKAALSYPITFCALNDFEKWLPKKNFSQIVIITDNTIKKLYGMKLQRVFKKASHKNLLLSFAAGEKFKNAKTKQTLENAMLAQQCDRQTLIVALGGGVVGDLAGFIASTYLRGVPYIQVPTTLLAMVDSSVGGKTGINTAHGKNLVGAIYQPQSVVIDINLLASLSQKHITNGLIEAFKMFLTHDADSFYYAQTHLENIIQGDLLILKEIITRAVKIKAGVVVRDEKEQGERSILNFGHTIGHALEKISNYKLLHGYAVGYGLLVEATISHLHGLLAQEQLSSIKNFLSQLGVHGKHLKKYALSDLLIATKNDKKARAGITHYVLLQSIGATLFTNGNHVHPIADKIVKQAFKHVLEG